MAENGDKDVVPAVNDDMDDETLCPITLEVMTDPVVTVEGFTYDRKSIEAWFKQSGAVSPSTGAVLNHTNLTPNLSIRKLISRRFPDMQLAPLSSTDRNANAEEKKEGSEGQDTQNGWNIRWPKFGSSFWRDWSYFTITSSAEAQRAESLPPEHQGYEMLKVAVVSLKTRKHARRKEISNAQVPSNGDVSSFYSVLEVDSAATQKEIKEAYYRVAKLWHPDKTTHPDAEMRFKAISEAYYTLSDPARRRAYDAHVACGGDPLRAGQGEAFSKEDVLAFLRTLFGGGEFEDIFGDPTTLPALHRVLNIVEGGAEAVEDEASLAALQQEEAKVCEALAWKLLRCLFRSDDTVNESSHCSRNFFPGSSSRFPVKSFNPILLMDIDFSAAELRHVSDSLTPDFTAVITILHHICSCINELGQLKQLENSHLQVQNGMSAVEDDLCTCARRVLERRTSGQLTEEEFGRWAREWAGTLLAAPGGMDLLQTVGLAYRRKARKFAQV